MDDEETKTSCPACKGAGKESIVRVDDPSNVGLYRFRICAYCRGEGLVTASRASGWRLKFAFAEDP